MSMQIILPGTGKELLRKELAQAFANAGCTVQHLAPEKLDAGALEELLADGSAAFVSVNFQGLENLPAVRDAFMRVYGKEKGRAGGRIAIWCVDNPWNLLAGQRDPAWRECSLFVTDESFVAPLKAHGAQRVFHLPLAASFAHFAPDKERDSAYPPPDNLAPFVFVGRSAFPGKERFFAGIRLPDDLLRTARTMLKAGERPDLGWWEERLLSGNEAFWPGAKARQCAFGAEEANLIWRAFCLQQAAKAGRGTEKPGLDVFGDEGWKGIVPTGGRLHPPVDYYARLPGIYRESRYSLALTSLQLPKGLNQRHFDVWAAGGVCLSDDTPGLALFPEELTAPIRFKTSQNIAATAEKLEKNHNRNQLVADWQNLLREKHSYADRVDAILQALRKD